MLYFPAECVLADLIRSAKEKNLKVKDQFGCLPGEKRCPGQEVEDGSWRR